MEKKRLYQKGPLRWIKYKDGIFTLANENEEESHRHRHRHRCASG
ncbi:uncharacterized protein G2W53_020451 [Senna tora]|uniref:Uncharacterized protein n=1 Tax=Senna tora TaxID=362788 RepID=A0A834TXX5_9FABA|nr:uncharacterized protein G2W53_020451 [Senna tora]